MKHEMISKSFKSKSGCHIMAAAWRDPYLIQGTFCRHCWIVSCRNWCLPAASESLDAWRPLAPGMAWIIWNPTFYNTINTTWLVRIAKFRQPQVVCEPSKPQLGAEMSCFHAFDLCLRVQGLWLEEYCMSFKGQHSSGWSKNLTVEF